MDKCVNCGGSHLTLSMSGEAKKCRDCGCANLVVRREHVSAAFKTQRLLESGCPRRIQEEGS